MNRVPEIGCQKATKGAAMRKNVSDCVVYVEPAVFLPALGLSPIGATAECFLRGEATTFG